MRISEFISVLKDIEEFYGDKYIWNVDIDCFPCPKKLEVLLVGSIEETSFGYKGIGGGRKNITIDLEYDGVKYVDRCFLDSEEME